MSNEEPHRFAAKAQELRAANPALEIVLVEAKDQPELDALVRPPTAAEWRHTKIMVDDPKTRNDANAWAVQVCCLWPDPKGDEFKALAARHPVWVDRLAGQIAILGGALIEMTARKL